MLDDFLIISVRFLYINILPISDMEETLQNDCISNATM